MPFVNVKLAGSISKEQKKEIAKEITETLQKHAHKPPSYTYIVFEEVKMEDWAIGGSLLGWCEILLIRHSVHDTESSDFYSLAL